VAITGSYGKTMLKDFLHAIISVKRKSFASPESFNSQLGVPLSILRVSGQDEIAIIEAGISQNNEMDSLQKMILPNCAILTNVGDAHISSLNSLENTKKEKIKLLQDHQHLEWVITPSTDIHAGHTKKHYHWKEHFLELPHATPLPCTPKPTMPYQIKFPSGLEFQGEIRTGYSYFLDLVNMGIKASHLLGIPEDTVVEVLKHYTPEPIRTELWKSPVGTTFINDAYCSDPQSIETALKQFQQFPQKAKKIFAFGGIRKSPTSTANDYKRAAQAINRSNVNTLYLYGDHQFAPLIDELQKSHNPVEILRLDTYQEVLKTLNHTIHPDDVVLIKGANKESLEKLTTAFNDSISNNQCLINLSAIRSNIEAIRQKVGSTRLLVIVKAFAYGTDDVRMSKFLANCGVDILGVSYIDEGVSLRRAGVTNDIFVINVAPYEAKKVLKWNLEVGVSHYDVIQALETESTLQNKTIKVHLHVDTGMSRFGCRPEEALALAQAIQKCPHLTLEGIMTHFACADNPSEDDFTRQQIACFDQVIKQIEDQGIVLKWKHASNSSATMRFHLPQYNMVRIGLAVYGLNPSHVPQKSLRLRLALSLTSRIVGINICKKGDTVSYGRSYKVTRDKQIIAVIPIGYFDGLHRNYTGKGEVIVKGKKASMVGKICMDFMMIDITDIPEAQVGDTVLIFGTDDYGHFLSPEDLAIRGDSIVYELITCLGPRIQRIYINE
jgi:alanine racemase/UDP-N-acetylmuramoyl-tripeptide--D-alanyl-D-alanine ligase